MVAYKLEGHGYERFALVLKNKAASCPVYLTTTIPQKESLQVHFKVAVNTSIIIEYHLSSNNAFSLKNSLSASFAFACPSSSLKYSTWIEDKRTSPKTPYMKHLHSVSLTKAHNIKQPQTQLHAQIFNEPYFLKKAGL